MLIKSIEEFLMASQEGYKFHVQRSFGFWDSADPMTWTVERLLAEMKNNCLRTQPVQVKLAEYTNAKGAKWWHEDVSESPLYYNPEGGIPELTGREVSAFIED